MEPKPMWTIEGVTNDTILEAGLGVVAARRVTFSTVSGQRAYIVIPVADFSKERVNELVHDAAMEIEHVMNMQGPPVSPPLQEYQQSNDMQVQGSTY